MTEIRGVEELVEEALREVVELTPAETAAAVEQGAVLVDLREAFELRAEGRIPGALHVPRGVLEFVADPHREFHLPEFDPDRRIILHCAVGIRSALSAVTLQRMGYPDVAHLAGGIDAWRDAGLPVEPVERVDR